jgi:hypothetical protein
MRRFDEDYKPNMKEKAPPCTDLSASKAIDGLHSKLGQAPFAAWSGRIVVTHQFHKRMVLGVSIGHQTQRRIAHGIAITPRLVHNMLRLSGVSGA